MKQLASIAHEKKFSGFCNIFEAKCIRSERVSNRAACLICCGPKPNHP